MNLVALALRIAKIRKERGLTLQQCAERSGLTRSVLSKVENFRVTPSLPALGRIAQSLGVTVADLVTGLDDRPHLVVVRKEERLQIQRDQPDSPFVYQALAHPRPNKAMEPFIVTIPAGVVRKECLAHDGEEFFLVLEGQLAYEYGDTVAELDEGDAVYADGTVTHRLRNTGAEPARVLIIFAATGTEE